MSTQEIDYGRTNLDDDDNNEDEKSTDEEDDLTDHD